MSEQVFWIVEFSIGEGNLEGFKALMNEMVEATRDQLGTTHYEWFLSEDGRSCHIHERYASSEAVLAHLGHFGMKYAGRMAQLAKATRVTIYGSPSEMVRRAMAPAKPAYMGQIGGFARD